MSFEIELFAQEMTDMSLQIEVCQWCVSLSMLEADSADHETHQERFVWTEIRKDRKEEGREDVHSKFLRRDCAL